MAELIKLNDFVIYLEKNTDNLCRSWIVEVIADIHHGITVIHPFTDGNGRTSRGMIKMLMRYRIWLFSTLTWSKKKNTIMRLKLQTREKF